MSEKTSGIEMRFHLLRPANISQTMSDGLYFAQFSPLKFPLKSRSV